MCQCLSSTLFALFSVYNRLREEKQDAFENRKTKRRSRVFHHGGTRSPQHFDFATGTGLCNCKHNCVPCGTGSVGDRVLRQFCARAHPRSRARGKSGGDPALRLLTERTGQEDSGSLRCGKIFTVYRKGRSMRRNVKNSLSAVFSAQSENESLARVMAAGCLLPHPVTAEELADIKTALSEAVTNALVHGYRGRSGQGRFLPVFRRPRAHHRHGSRARDRGRGTRQRAVFYHGSRP